MNFLTYLLFTTIPLGQTVFLEHIYLNEIIISFIFICLPLLPKRKENNRILPLDVVIFLFGLSSLISVAIGSESFYESARFYRQMVLSPMLLYMLVRLIPVSMTTIVKAFYFMAGSVFFQALFYCYFYSSYGLRPIRGTGFIESPITSSLFFCIGFFVLFYCRKLIYSKMLRVVLAFCGLLFVAALIVSSTRAAVIGVIIVLVSNKLFWQTRKMRKVYYFLFMSFLFVFLGAVSFHTFSHHKISIDMNKTKEIQHSTVRLISPDTYLKDINERLSFWSSMARKVVFNRPFLGFGSSGYSIGKIKGVGFSLGSVHNFLISSLITSGLLGLILLLFLIYYTFSSFVYVDEKSDQMMVVSRLLQASFTVLILVALTNDLTGGRVNVFFFLMALSSNLLQRSQLSNG